MLAKLLLWAWSALMLHMTLVIAIPLVPAHPTCMCVGGVTTPFYSPGGKQEEPISFQVPLVVALQTQATRGGLASSLGPLVHFALQDKVSPLALTPQSVGQLPSDEAGSLALLQAAVDEQEGWGRNMRIRGGGDKGALLQRALLFGLLSFTPSRFAEHVATWPCRSRAAFQLLSTAPC